MSHKYELAGAPWVTSNQVSNAGAVLQDDGPPADVPDVDHHGEIEEQGILVPHPEPGEQAQHHLPAGGLLGDDNSLVGQVRPQTSCIHFDRGRFDGTGLRPSWLGPMLGNRGHAVVTGTLVEGAEAHAFLPVHLIQDIS